MHAVTVNPRTSATATQIVVLIGLLSRMFKMGHAALAALARAAGWAFSFSQSFPRLFLLYRAGLAFAHLRSVAAQLAMFASSGAIDPCHDKYGRSDASPKSALLNRYRQPSIPQQANSQQDNESANKDRHEAIDPKREWHGDNLFPKV